MRKGFSCSIVMFFAIFLAACADEDNVASLYKQENPIDVEIMIPEKFTENQQETIKAKLTQAGEPVEGADYVHFEMWNQEGTVHYEMEQANEEGKGIYSLSKDFNEEGLYFVQVHASNNGSVIMPKKQFVVGKLTANDEEFLKENKKPQSGGHEGHH
ncbi:FixH family protein [Metabacillus schmidteae]|uniref:FixH family protein n=1 Tax=Metabacillus schmidteae TaxID=2730405 RepID=UPI00158D7C0A|nr:FixH family protein [Metabacillus schmidteae]